MCHLTIKTSYLMVIVARYDLQDALREIEPKNIWLSYSNLLDVIVFAASSQIVEVSLNER